MMAQVDELRAAAAKAEQPPLVSIVIVSWNEWPKLELCLRSIYRSALPFEVLVVDNASADGTPELLRTHFPDVALHCNERNLGATKALNFGFRRARGEFVLKLDADTELLPNCLERLLDFLRQCPLADVVAPRTLNTDGTIQETARRFPSAVSGIFGRQSMLTRLFPSNRFARRYLARDFIDAKEPFEVDQVGGAFMLFRRQLLTEVGYLDEGYFLYWDDTDWCYRVRAAGKRIFCVPAAVAFHHENNARGKRKRPARIWRFHYGAHRVFTRWRTLGYWDPRSIVAGVALYGRAILLISYHCILNLRSPPRRGGARDRTSADTSRLGADRR
jgi:N-acetylglucosaminyl-diphospho-decaprenol L-rhamnosyltransferase